MALIWHSPSIKANVKIILILYLPKPHTPFLQLPKVRRSIWKSDGVRMSEISFIDHRYIKCRAHKSRARFRRRDLLTRTCSNCSSRSNRAQTLPGLAVPCAKCQTTGRVDQSVLLAEGMCTQKSAFSTLKSSFFLKAATGSTFQCEDVKVLVLPP